MIRKWLLESLRSTLLTIIFGFNRGPLLDDSRDAIFYTGWKVPSGPRKKDLRVIRDA
jgi:hypothetical protein